MKNLSSCCGLVNAKIRASEKDLPYNSGKPHPDAPRMRFDRIYFRQSQPCRLFPKTFKLIGTEKVPGTSQFPSDHWGILTTFKIDSNLEIIGNDHSKFEIREKTFGSIQKMLMNKKVPGKANNGEF